MYHVNDNSELLTYWLYGYYIINISDLLLEFSLLYYWYTVFYIHFLKELALLLSDFADLPIYMGYIKQHITLVYSIL